MKKWTRWVIWGGLAAVVVWLVVERASQPSEAEAAGGRGGGNGPLAAKVYVTAKEHLAEKVAVSGTLLANEEVELTSETSGKITGIYFQEGSRVQKGQLLVQLNDAELKAQLAQAHSRLRLLEAQEYRQRVLLDKEAVSQQEYDIVANDLANALAEIELVQARLAQTRIVAPFAGTVGLRRVSLGSYVSAGSAIATLQNLDLIKIEFSVPEVYAASVRQGGSVNFSVRGTNDSFTATVFAIEPKIDPQTRSLLVRARIQNSYQLVPGAYSDVSLVLSVDTAAVLVPTQCVVTEAAGQMVFQVQGGKVTPTPVMIGTRSDRYVYIRQGLAAGDTVLVSGLLQARSDVPVRVTEVVHGPLASENAAKN